MLIFIYLFLYIHIIIIISIVGFLFMYVQQFYQYIVLSVRVWVLRMYLIIV